MKVHMVKYYSISKSFNVIDDRKKNYWGKKAKKIMIPITIINLRCFKSDLCQKEANSKLQKASHIQYHELNFLQQKYQQN